MLIKNLRRAAAVAIVAPVMVISGSGAAMAQSGPAGRHIVSANDDSGDGILSDLVTVNLGRDSDRRDNREDDGILSNLITVDLGSSGRDNDRRHNRNDRDDRDDRDDILNNTLGGGGLLGGGDDLLSLRIL